MEKINLAAAPKNMTGLEVGRWRLDQVVKTGKEQAKRVIQYVQALKPVDRIIKAKDLQFSNSTERVGDMQVHRAGEMAQRLHPHALNQACDKAGIPTGYAERLRGNGIWGPALLAINLNEIYHHSENKHLLRSVENQIRAVLSDRFKRLDSGPLIDAFAGAIQTVGAIPYAGYVSDTKIGLQAIIPKVYQPIENDPMAYGVSFENSDFGNGAMNVAVFLLRLRSLTGMIGPDHLRRVHLGKRLDEDMDWSDETKQLDLQTVCSGVKDLVTKSLSDERIEAMQVLIYEASLIADEAQLELTTEMLKGFLTKAELDRLTEKYNALDIETLPPGNSLWRLSSAVAWLAGEQEDSDRQLELQKFAGKVLQSKPSPAAKSKKVKK